MRIEYLIDYQRFLPALACLHFKEWSYLNPRETLEERTQRLAGLCGRCEIPTAFVAIVDQDLVGSALLVTHDMKTRKEFSPWLAGVYVKPAHRQTGVASRLIARVEAKAAALNTKRLYLYTPSEEAYYARRGWQPLERTEYNGTQVTIMDKAIATGSLDAMRR